MQKIIEGKLEYFDGGYEGGDFIINNSLLDNELMEFENKKVRIVIEDIE